MLKISDWLLEPHTPAGFQKFEAGDHIEVGGTVHHTEYLHFNIQKRYALVNITELLEAILDRSRVYDGFCFVSTLHITAGIYINDAESGLLQDIARWLEGIAPFGKNYLHHQTGEDNGDAHLKSYLTNSSVTLPITKSRLDLGRWQQAFYAEFDGRRNKRLIVKISGLNPTKSA